MQTLSRTLSFLILLWLFWLAWQHLGPRKPELGPQRQVLVDRVVVAIVEDIQKHRGDARRAVLIHFVNDPTDKVTNGLRRLIELRGVLDLADRTFMEKLRELLQMRQPSSFDVAHAALTARQAEVDLAIIGLVEKLESGPEGGKATIRYRLVSAGGNIVHEGTFEESISGSLVAPAMPESVTPGWRQLLQRALLWLALVLLLPVFSISFIRFMVRRNSNAANAFVLGIYTLVAMVSAWLFFTDALQGWVMGWVILGAAIIAFIYTAHIISLAIRLEE